MVDKYRIFDTPKSWRLRNGVEVPEEYLNAHKKSGMQLLVLIAALVFSSLSIGYDFGFFAASEVSDERISQLEDKFNSLKANYWKQVTLSEYLAMETFDFETERVSSGKGEVLLVDVDRSTYFEYMCSDDWIWSCGLTEYNSTSVGVEGHPRGGGGVVHI